MKKIIYATMILFLTVSACQEKPDDEPSFGELPDAEPISIHLAEKVETDNAFAFDVFKTTCKYSQEANVFVSPLSISIALNMTLNGAVGETADEMLDALRAKGYTIDDINEYSRSLRTALMEVDPSTDFSIANSIWYRENFSVKPAFLDVNRTNYAAEVKALDFSSPNAVTQINNWCAQQTNDKIRTIVETISPSTMMYLINAVYFKGIWVSKFDKNNTRKEDFHTSDGQTVQVQMMQQTQSFNYTADEYGRYLELPYGNKAFSMIVMLPEDGKTAEDIIEHLNGDQWNRTVKNMYGQLVNLHLPRFKSECEYKMHEKILPEMGMQIPFSDNADFSGISDERLRISKVIHKTFVEVNEEGTEAAAVTSVEMEVTSVGPTQPMDYIVNKPFLYAIREKSTGVILFMGKAGEIEQ